MSDKKMPPGGAAFVEPPVEHTFRLAFRAQGPMWVAYYSPDGDMDNAVIVGAVSYAVVDSNKARRQQFIALIQDIVGDIVEKHSGMRPRWDNPEYSVRREDVPPEIPEEGKKARKKKPVKH